MTRLKDDKVCSLYRREERFTRAVQQQRKLCLQILSWFEECRIWLLLLNDADDILAMTRSLLLCPLNTKDKVFSRDLLNLFMDCHVWLLLQYDGSL